MSPFDAQLTAEAVARSIPKWTEELTRALSERISGEVRADDMTRALYSTDASIYRATPLAVAIPETVDDLRAIVEFAGECGLPLLPRGGGTSLEGQTVNEALVFDCSAHLNRVLEINVEERWARVQPGVLQEGLRRHVRPLGLTFGPDTATASRATLGGMIGNNSAGSRSIVYGKTIDHVIELECLLADGTEIVVEPLDRDGWQAKQRAGGVEGGLYRTVAAVAERHADEVRRRFPRVMRRVSGYNLDEFVDGAGHERARSERFGPYNLARLLVGSEGTLATVVAAKVNLERLPEATGLAVVQFPDIVAAMEATRRIVGTGPSAVELVDRLVLRQAQENPVLSRICDFVEGDPAAVLITEYYGETDAEVADRVESLRRLLEREGLGYGFHAALSQQAQDNVWAVRKQGLALLLSVKGDAKPIAFVEDTAVDVDRLPEYVQRLQRVVEDHDTWAGFYGHASVGCLHFRPAINLKAGDDIRRLRSIAEDIRDLTMEFDGALSGEHGDGRARTEFLPQFYGDEIYGAFRTLKTAFDPEGRLNPGNICDPLPASSTEGLKPRRQPAERPPYVVDRDLRYGTGYRARDVGRYLDWSEEGGFDRAVEMCNGNGHCRKVESGTMCPSYMVTRDEEHSTRGRANALREVIAGDVPATGFTSRRLYDVLDLCLECKGCKGECPSNVDMAKLKYEFLAQYHEEHGTPLRARLFGHVATTSEWGSRVAPLANALLSSPPARWLNEVLLGVSRHRPLPRYASPTFEEWFHSRARTGPAGPAGSGGPAGSAASPDATAASGMDDRGQKHGDTPPSGALGPDGGGNSRRGDATPPDTPPTTAGNRGQVVLFHDTFMNFNVPSVGRAAVRVLEEAGYEVVLVEKVCCGRPMLSSGLVEDARHNARRNVSVLAPWVRRGVPVVGCEPSCLLMLREDYLDLLPGDPAAREVAEGAHLIEELLYEAADAAGDEDERPLGFRFREVDRDILLHGHCHQKASVGVAPTLRMLGWVPGYRPRALDSGCCGMAGKFGYEAEHYDLSMAIGERVLFPAVRSSPEAGVAVSGISCRQQVSHGTGRQGLHPIEWLADALEP